MRTIGLCMLCIFLSVTFSVANAEEQSPAQVMLFGVFHFANPGRDVVNMTVPQ